MKVNEYLEKLKSETPKRKNSRRKGLNFENKVCKLLNERFKTEEFSRTPGSGAYATTHKLPEYLKIYGDLICPKNFLWTVETKKGYNNFFLHDLLNKTSQLGEMLEECERVEKVSRKPFIFIICQDRRPALAFIKRDLIGIVTHLETLQVRQYVCLTLEDLLKFEDSFFIAT